MDILKGLPQKKNLDVKLIFINKIEVNKAIKGRRRTFRAHGRINNFNSNPCHVQVFLLEKNKSIPKCNLSIN